MAITYLGQQFVPSVDDANETSTTCILDKDVAPFTTLANGDFVMIYTVFKNTGVTTSVTTTGGQTWTEQNDSSHNNTTFSLYYCFFNGTWDADPVITQSGAAAPRLMWAVALSGVDSTTPWDVTPVFTSQAASTTFVEATFDTVTNGALAIVGAGANDNNTWSVDNSFTAPSGSGNVYWRTSGGTDASIVLCTKAIATAGAVGATTMTQVTLGGDAGARWHGALKPSAGDPNATVTPSTIAVSAAVGAQTTLAAALTAPSAVAVTSSLPAPTLSATAIVQPSTVAATAALPAPTIIATSPDATVTPSTVAVAAAIPAPMLAAAARPTPSSVASTAAILAPTVSGAALTAPSAVAIAAAVGTPTVGGAAITQPSTIAALAALPVPTIIATSGGNATATPATIAVVVSLLTPTIIAGDAGGPVDEPRAVFLGLEGRAETQGTEGIARLVEV